MDNIVCSPILGTIINLSKVPDEAFSQKMMGEGIAIIPKEGKVFAPFDGIAEVVPDTKHALGLVSTSGIELLIHVGLETVELDGMYYTMHTEEGSSVTKGDLLLEFDIEEIQKKGYNLVTPITVINMDNYTSISLPMAENTEVSVSDDIIILEK